MSTLNKLGQLFSQKALRSLGAGVAVGSIMLGLGAFAKPASAVVIGGQELDEGAYADQLIDYSGSFVTSGGTVEDVVLDDNVATFALSYDVGSYVTLGFTNPILNSSGDDLALFDLGFADVFSVTINNITNTYQTVETGEYTEDPVYSINLATIDFSDFDIAEGDYVSQIFIGLDSPSPYGTPVSLALVAGIRSVPEPSTMFGLLATAGFLAYQRKSKLTKKV